jgi:UDP-N-acetylmuramoyl-L-alanyl-D-glutamate--2,6-diaminopimelate ligase
MRLRELAAAARPRRLAGNPEIEISGLRHDSRLVQKGDLFFALPGAKTDGNRHIKAACEQGAAAVVSELEPPPPPAVVPAAWLQVDDAAAAMGAMADRFFGHPSGAMTVFGVTGTNGKTTTTYFLESIVSAAGGTPGVVGTVDYRLGGRVVSKAPNTTPISLELQRLLASFRDGGATHACMEVSSHALSLKRVEEVDFDAAIFTNLTQDHLDFHHTMDEYLKAKVHLFELLSKTNSAKKKRVAAVNADDSHFAAFLRASAIAAEPVKFGLSENADFRGVELQPTLTGTSFTIRWKGKRLEANINLVGEHNVYNALGAAAASLGLGMRQDAVLRGLASLTHVPGRLEPVNAGQDFAVLVDYAHTPAALETVLSFIRKLPHNRIITVFGCGGDRDRTKRGPMGLAACRSSDLAIITSDNPRGEEPAAIIADITAALTSAGVKNYKIHPDRADAIAAAVREARGGDVVLIAGKGHEDYQILRDRTIPFDDRQAARAALGQRR